VLTISKLNSSRYFDKINVEFADISGTSEGVLESKISELETKNIKRCS
jgi:hypothetical protein